MARALKLRRVAGSRFHYVRSQPLRHYSSPQPEGNKADGTGGKQDERRRLGHARNGKLLDAAGAGIADIDVPRRIGHHAIGIIKFAVLRAVAAKLGDEDMLGVVDEHVVVQANLVVCHGDENVSRTVDGNPFGEGFFERIT